MKQTPLSDLTVEIILGSLLGDSSIAINKNYSNARLSFRHSIKQEAYFTWKVNNLAEVASDKNVWKQGDLSAKDGWGSEKLRFQSKALPQLTEILTLVAPKGRKLVRRKWLNRLTPLSLAVWWCDDGSLVKNTRAGVFCTDSYSYEEVVLIKKYLKKVWDIETKIGFTSKNNKRERRYYRLYIRSTEELKKFLRIIAPHIPVKEMLYKILVLYKDSEIQQRWISEITQLSKFDEATIKEVVSERKAQLKSFRE